MLDSNTDRSYFMIGAIIVGALIIGGAVLIFNFLFTGDGSGLQGAGKIGELLNSMFTGAEEGINGITPNIIIPAIKSIF